MRIMNIILLLLSVNYCLAQQTEFVDFLKAKVEVRPNPIKKNIKGIVGYEFKILKDIDSVFIDAKSMKFGNVSLMQNKFQYRNDGKRLWIIYPFKKNKQYSILFNYEATPKKAIYYIGWDNEGENQIWTQGQGKYTSNWLPSIDDMNDKIEFDLTIQFDEEYNVIANGELTGIGTIPGYKNWKFNMHEPMSSYLVAFAIGKYKKKTAISKSGIPLEMYYYPQDEAKFESTYRYTKELFDFLEEEIGVPYPWQNYKQVPVKDFLYAGMENTSTTIFSDAFVVDSTAFVDKNYVNVNAHELAHQWFGDMVTETSGKHHWLQEGFATYYALLAEKEIFGEDYYYYKLYQTSQQLLQAQETDTIPLLNPKASSLTFYQKGAWALYSLREQVGDSVFKESVKKYLHKYQFSNVVTSDFISIVEQESKQDLNEFINTWLLSNKFSRSNGTNVLKKISANSIYRKCIDYRMMEASTITSDMFSVKNLKVRQILAEKMHTIPLKLKSDYEGLLNDKSYITIETALFNLWLQFPEDRMSYLKQTKDIIGFNDKNIRTLWLALALNTKGFLVNRYQGFYDELVSYTSPKHHFETRKNAFVYLNELKMFNSIALENLMNGAQHHNWRFKKYCKDLLSKKTEK